jgi:hypothetical protein
MLSSIFINDRELKKNNVRIIHCRNWDDYTRKLKKVVTVNIDNPPEEIPSKIIYRGHASNQWNLSSQLERIFSSQRMSLSPYEISIKSNMKKNAKEYYVYTQKRLLERFKFLSSGIVGIDLNKKSEYEIWALGRHNGLITPLLDWTESPYIAAFFAFIEQYHKFKFNLTLPELFSNEEKVYVWGLRCYTNLEVKNEFEIIRPPRNFGSRLWAQAGLFTRLFTNEYFDLQSYLKSRGVAHYLDCFEIPIKSAAAALADLNLMNITLSKLFPDLTGAALEANIVEQHFEVSRIQTELLSKRKIVKGRKK